MFSGDTAKQAQWRAFVRRSRTTPVVPSLAELIVVLRAFLLPLVDALREGREFTLTWSPGGPWDFGSSAGGGPTG